MYVIKNTDDDTYYHKWHWRGVDKGGLVFIEDINKAQLFKSRAACKNSRASDQRLSDEYVAFKAKWKEASEEDRKLLKRPKTYYTNDLPEGLVIVEINIQEK